MKLVADESVDRPVVEALREAGHAVHAIAEVSPGVRDEVVLETAAGLGAVLLTADKDFGELVFRRRLSSAGVVLLRLSGLGPREKADLVKLVFSLHEPRLHATFTVVEPRALRIRPARVP